MTAQARPLRDILLQSENEILDLASEMIAVPSPTGQEGPMGQWLSQWLSRHGFEVEAFDLDPDMMQAHYKELFFRWHFPYENRPNVVGRLPGTGGGRSLMINFHLDVVEAEADFWESDPWTATRKGDHLVGRGACDMKGGAAAALFAVKTLLEQKIPLKGDLIIAGVIEEEGPGNGTLALQAREICADACIIPEPTELTAAIGVTGGVYGFISIPGKPAHSTTPWNGINAVEKSLLVHQGLENWKARRRRAPVGPLFAHAPDTAAAAGIVSINRTDDNAVGKVPASANVMVRATVLPGETPDAVTKGIEAAILDAAREDQWLAAHPPEFSWLTVGARNHSAALAPAHPLCTGLETAFETVTGTPIDKTALVSPADMQQLLNHEPTTPTLMFGPGSLDQAHTHNESVPVDHLVKASAVMGEFIQAWCNADPIS